MGRFYGALILVALIGVGLIGYVMMRPKPAPAVTTINDPNLAGEARGYLLGDSTAPVRIVEFADFECPACANYATVTEPDVRTKLVQTGRASVYYFDFPLDQHRNTLAASNAAACASDQGKFWEMHDKLFAGQDEWNTQATSNPKKVFARYAEQLGLNTAQWEQCFDSQKHARQIAANKAAGERWQVSQTPTFIIGKKKVPGALPYDMLRAYVDSAATEAAVSGVTGAAANPTPAGAGTGAAGATSGAAAKKTP
jgi:protein-disulfide isomerase